MYNLLLSYCKKHRLRFYAFLRTYYYYYYKNMNDVNTRNTESMLSDQQLNTTNEHNQLKRDLVNILLHYSSPCGATYPLASALAPTPREGPINPGIKHDGRCR